MGAETNPRPSPIGLLLVVHLLHVFLLESRRPTPRNAVKICDVTQFYSPVSGGVKRYISEKRRYTVEHTRDEHHLIIPGSDNRYEREGRLHLHTIRSPRLDFFSRYPSRYRLILNTHLVLDMLDEIALIFADNVKGTAVLCTGHKAKGREWSRVYWILPKTGGRRSRKDWEQIQESNLCYVICTRAKSELVLVPEP